MEKPRTGPSEQVSLPAGFRFHPTDEELVVSYLIHKAEGRPFPIPIIAEVDLYKFDPWELPEKALFGEREWYFFSPRDRKYPNGARPNRAAASGYWKATGTDKPIQSKNRKVGVKKALVFYKGKAPKGLKTNWIMHEYRLAESRTPLLPARKKGSLRLDDWVLCRIYKKSTGAYKVMMSSTPKGNAAKPEPEEELDEVLASLPDIDTDNNNHKFKMPPQFAGPTGGGGTGNGNMNSFFPGMDQMFADEEHENSENTTQQQAMSLSYHHPSSSLTNASYEDYYNSSIYNNSNGPMVMMNKVNSWAYDGQTGTTGQQHYQNDVSMNRVINPPPIKLEKVPSNISDILLQIQQQNCSSRKRKVEDEDDVQSTCRSPVPRTRQGFTFDFPTVHSHHMV